MNSVLERPNYTDAVIKDYEEPETVELRNHYVILHIEPWRYNYLATNFWQCPNNDKNRKILPKSEWERCLQLFKACGKTVCVEPQAEICSILRYEGKTTYIVWLEFTGPDGYKYKFDVKISELDSKGNKNLEKHVDPRSPLCKDVYAALIKNKSLPPQLLQLLTTFGAETWEGSLAEKLQYKLNSFKQQECFEQAVKKHSKFVTAEQLDPNDDKLYRGDPGKLADYDLTFTFADNKTITCRVDLKLLPNLDTLPTQNPHDAELLLGSTWKPKTKVAHCRIINNTQRIEESEEFQNLMDSFRRELAKAGKCFIGIKSIDMKSGEIDFFMFGSAEESL